VIPAGGVVIVVLVLAFNVTEDPTNVLVPSWHVITMILC
jgi:hypothetical protein